MRDNDLGPDADGPDAAAAGEALAREIRRHRHLAGLSHAQLAAKIGYSRQYVSVAERSGKGVASGDLVRAIDTALHTNGALTALHAQAVAERRARRPRAGHIAGEVADADGMTGPRRVVRSRQHHEEVAAPQSRVLLPVLVDGRQVLLPLEASAVAGSDLALAVSLAPSLGYSSRLAARSPSAERAYELYLRGQGLLATNDKRHVEAATSLLDRALDIDPHFARAQAAHGYAQWRQYFSGWGSAPPTLEGALVDVDAALRRDPDSIGARMTLIRICWDMGWHERALEVGRAVYEKNPDSLDATLAFARALNNSGMAAAALPLTRAVLQVDPSNPTALKLLIWNHLMVGDYPSALQAARLYLPLSPRDSNTRWAVALAHLGNADLHEAIRTAHDAVTADPDDVTVWNLHGYLLRRSGDTNAAHAVWSTGIAHFATRAGMAAQLNLRVQAWLANIEACVGRIEQARARVARITAAEPRNGYLKYRLTHVLAELGDATAAVRTLHEAVQDGFLSEQLLRHDERLGLSSLVGLAEYRRVSHNLHDNVQRVRSKYAPVS